MAKMLNSNNYGDKLYNSLPVLYRVSDREVNLALKRYLSVLADGGFKYNIDELNGILSLNDPTETPTEILPIIFAQYGLEIFHGLPELYLRNLLPILRDLYARKGATTVVEYLTSQITNVEADITYDEDYYNNYRLYLNIHLDTDDTNVPDREQLLRIIREFLPFFVETIIVFIYMYYDEATLIGVDHDFLDEVKTDQDENLSIVPAQGLLYYNLLNVETKKLNSTFILNDSYYVNEEIDPYEDKLKPLEYDSGVFDEDTTVDEVVGESFNLESLLELIFLDTDDSHVDAMTELTPYADSQELSDSDEHISYYIKENTSETPSINSEYALGYYLPMLNNAEEDKYLNSTLILNKGAFTDGMKDIITVGDEVTKIYW